MGAHYFTKSQPNGCAIDVYGASTQQGALLDNNTEKSPRHLNHVPPIRTLARALEILVLVSLTATTAHAFAGAGQSGVDLTGLSNLTGLKAKVVVNYRDQSASSPTDHSAGDLGLTNDISTIALVVADQPPLSNSFDQLWSGTKDKNGQTLRDRATAQAVAEIKQSGGSNVGGTGFPQKGTLYCNCNLAQVGDPLTFSYVLPTVSFIFNEGDFGASWNLTFNVFLTVTVSLQDWPSVPAATGVIHVANANISANNVGASVDEALKEMQTFFSTANSGIDGGNIFAIQEGQIESTPTPTLDITSIGTLLATLAKPAYPMGFTKCRTFVGATKAGTPEGTPPETFNIRLVHPVDPGPKLANTALRTGLQLLSPAINPSQTQLSAGDKLVLTGTHFPIAQADAIYVAWDDTVSGTIVKSEIKWSAPGHPDMHADISRTPFDDHANYTITGLDPDTSYDVQVRDADQLTYTDWGAVLAVKTQLNNNADISLKNGPESVSLGTAKRDSSGNFTADLTVPTGTKSGDYAITATDGSVDASTTIQVLGAGQSATPKLSVLNTTTGLSFSTPVLMPAGATFRLHGEGFKPGTAAVAIQAGKSLANANVGTDGTFDVDVTPAVETGGYTIVASQGAGATQLEATLSFEILVPPK